MVKKKKKDLHVQCSLHGVVPHPLPSEYHNATMSPLCVLILNNTVTDHRLFKASRLKSQLDWKRDQIKLFRNRCATWRYGRQRETPGHTTKVYGHRSPQEQY